MKLSLLRSPPCSDDITLIRISEERRISTLGVFRIADFTKLIAMKLFVRFHRRASLSEFYLLKADKETIDIMERQINEYSAMRVQAQMELGKRIEEMEIGSGGDRKSAEFQNSNGRIFETKSDKLSELNISTQRASEFETMARNEETVNQFRSRGYMPRFFSISNEKTNPATISAAGFIVEGE